MKIQVNLNEINDTLENIDFKQIKRNHSFIDRLSRYNIFKCRVFSNSFRRKWEKQQKNISQTSFIIYTHNCVREVFEVDRFHYRQRYFNACVLYLYYSYLSDIFVLYYSFLLFILWVIFTVL